MIELNLIGFVKFIFVIVLLIIYFISFLRAIYVRNNRFYTLINYINVLIVYFVGVNVIINLLFEKFFG
jgi:hypothetical protein